MLQTMDSGVNHAHNVTWLENLTRGAGALLLHPFLPFYETKFDYKCLFSKHSYCCNQWDPKVDPRQISANNDYLNKSYTRYFDLFRDNLRLLIEGLDFTHRPLDKNPIETGESLVSRASGLCINMMRFVKIKPKNMFLISQLILCSISLSFFIVKDIKDVVRYVKTSKIRDGKFSGN